MNLIKQYIVVIIFMGLAGIPMLLSIYFYVSKITIEYEMERALACSNLEEINIPTGKIVWLKKKKEILVNNEPFDIKSYRQQGDVTIFKGLFDKKEKELKNKILAYTKEKDRENQEHLFQIIFLFFFIEPQQPYSEYCFIQLPFNFNLYRELNLSNHFPSLKTPPPRVCQFPETS